MSPGQRQTRQGHPELGRLLGVRNRFYSPIFCGQIDSFVVTFRSDNQPKYPPSAPGSPQLYLSCGRHQFSTGYELPSLCCPCFAAFCLLLSSSFSCKYELPNLQLLCFDNDATVPGGGGASPFILLKSYFKWASIQGCGFSSSVYPGRSRESASRRISLQL